MQQSQPLSGLKGVGHVISSQSWADCPLTACPLTARDGCLFINSLTWTIKPRRLVSANRRRAFSWNLFQLNPYIRFLNYSNHIFSWWTWMFGALPGLPRQWSRSCEQMVAGESLDIFNNFECLAQLLPMLFLNSLAMVCVKFKLSQNRNHGFRTWTHHAT